MGEKIKRAIGVKGDFKTAVVPMMNYSYANMFIGGAGYIISMYFTIFLTDVVNISLKQAGIVVMIATVWDAVTDPVMGIIPVQNTADTAAIFCGASPFCLYPTHCYGIPSALTERKIRRVQ